MDRPDRARAGRVAPLVAGSAALHVAALAALAVAPRRWPAIAAVLLADHLALTAAGLTPRSRLLGPNLTRLSEAAARRGEVALTFDDGPDPEVTPRVLEILDRRGVRATFFAVGRRVEACGSLAAEAARRGHLVENHTYNHSPAFSLLPPAALRREVERGQEAVERATGRRPALFRAPAGFRSLLLDPVLRRAGLALASWTRRGFDTVSGDPARVARRLLCALAPGDVLLLHDGSAARTGRGEPVVLEVLPRVLDALEERGFQAVPFLPEAPAAGEAEPA